MPAGGAMSRYWRCSRRVVGAVPLIVNVTLPPDGSVVIVLVTMLPATLTVPHTAPPVSEPQFAVMPVMPAGTGSLKLGAVRRGRPGVRDDDRV